MRIAASLIDCGWRRTDEASRSRAGRTPAEHPASLVRLLRRWLSGALLRAY